MKKLFVRFSVAAIFLVASVGIVNTQEIKITDSHGNNVPIEMKRVMVPRDTSSFCACSVHHCVKHRARTPPSLPVTTPSTPVVSTYTWQRPTIVTQVVIQQIVVPQPVVIQQAPIVQPVVYERQVVYETPRTIYYRTPLISFSASASVNSYGGGYYPQTYWQENSMCQEYRNIAETRRNYGMSGGRSYNNYGGYGGNHGGGRSRR